MKKFLIGCGIVSLIVCLCGGGCTLFVGYKIMELGSGIMEAADELNQLEDDFPFAQPAAGTPLDPDRFGDFRNARREIAERALAVPLVRKVAQNFDEENPEALGRISPLDILKGAFESPRVLKDIAAILRRHEMTPSEYRYHARQVFAVLHEGWEQQDQAMEGIWAAVRDQVTAIQVEIDSNKRQRGHEHQMDLVEEMDNAATGVEIDDTTYQIVKRHLDELAPSTTVVIMDLLAVQLIEELQMRGPSRGLPSQTRQPVPDVPAEPEPALVE